MQGIKMDELLGSDAADVLEKTRANAATPEDRTNSVAEVHGNISATLNYARIAAQPVYVTNRGKVVAAIVPTTVRGGDDGEFVRSVEDFAASKVADDNGPKKEG